MKQLIILLTISSFLFSCETTKLLYNSNSKPELTRLGIANLNKDNLNVDNVLPKLDSNFNTTSIIYCNKYLAKETFHLNENISYFSPDSIKIIELCSRNNLNGIILTHVHFRKIIHTMYTIKVDERYECILYTKLYDKHGKMHYNVQHDSKEDTYKKFPDAYDVINLSSGITYQKIYTARQKK